MVKFHHDLGLEKEEARIAFLQVLFQQRLDGNVTLGAVGVTKRSPEYCAKEARAEGRLNNVDVIARELALGELLLHVLHVHGARRELLAGCRTLVQIHKDIAQWHLLSGAVA